MPSENSFDIVSEANMQEIDNSVNNAVKEIANRFDFKGSKTQITLNKETKELVIISDDEYKLKSVLDILESKFIKRGVSMKFFDMGKVEPAAQMSVRQTAKIKQGFDKEKAKEVTKMIKELGLKVNPQIQDEKIRVISKSKDDLQTVMKTLREKNLDVPIQFTNFK
jgi:hypothetical protein